jgi:hypothetical protein
LISLCNFALKHDSGEEGFGRAISTLKSIGRKLRPSTNWKLKLPAKVADSFYASPPWRALLASIIKARGRRCEDPDHDEAMPRADRRIFGDHVVELRDGGAGLDARNVMLRC